MKSKKLPNKSILACETYSIIILESLRTIQIYASQIDKTQNKLKRNHSLQHGIKSKIASFLDKLILTENQYLLYPSTGDDIIAKMATANTTSMYITFMMGDFGFTFNTEKKIKSLSTTFKEKIFEFTKHIIVQTLN